MMSSMTAYMCPLCGEEVLRDSGELRQRREPNNDLVIETPLGYAMRIEGLLTAHMEEVHNLTSEQAVEKIRGVSNQEHDPAKRPT